MQVNLEVLDGSPYEVELLVTTIGALSNFRPALIDVAHWYMTRQRRVFATADSGAWAPLAAATVRRKGNGRINVDSGTMLRSFTQSGAAFHYERYTADTLRVGSNDPSNEQAVYNRRGRNLFGRDPNPALSAGEEASISNLILGHVLSAGGAGSSASGMLDLGWAS